MESARSLYKNDIDFEALALQSPDFAKLYVHFRILGKSDAEEPSGSNQINKWTSMTQLRSGMI